ACPQQSLDLGQGRACAGGEDQFLRLVERDAGHPRQVDRMLRLRRPADAALGAMAEDFERRFFRKRPLNGGERFGGSGWGEGGHACAEASSADIPMALMRATALRSKDMKVSAPIEIPTAAMTPSAKS